MRIALSRTLAAGCIAIALAACGGGGGGGAAPTPGPGPGAGQLPANSTLNGDVLTEYWDAGKTRVKGSGHVVMNGSQVANPFRRTGAWTYWYDTALFNKKPVLAKVTYDGTTGPQAITAYTTYNPDNLATTGATGSIQDDLTDVPNRTHIDSVPAVRRDGGQPAISL